MSKEKDLVIRGIDLATVERYHKRYLEHGVSHLTLGWGSREQQQYRFDVVLGNVAVASRSVLDIGCGFGDLLGYMDNRQVKQGCYTGLDVNTELVEDASRLYPHGTFIDKPLTEVDDSLRSDVVIMLGLMNFKQDKIANMDYARLMVEKAFSLTGYALVVDFLSARVIDGYPKEDFVYYYEPADVLDMGLSISADVKLVHDYKPIPQKEMMMILYKD